MIAERARWAYADAAMLRVSADHYDRHTPGRDALDEARKAYGGRA